MPDPVVQVLGAYKLHPTEELFDRALRLKYGGIQLSSDAAKEAERTVREELSSIALIEIALDFPDERFDLGQFIQPESDQAPYDEAYLSSDGSETLSRWKRPEGDHLRVAFYLHFFDQRRPLSTPYGDLALPELQEMPERLRALVPYRPVD
jgi:hypothetical protein